MRARRQFKKPVQLCGAWHGVRGAAHARWCENPAAIGLRFVGHAADIVRLRHTGWFTDSDGIGDLLRGIVYQLPSRGGRELYVYGYGDPSGGLAALLCFDLDADSKEQAARMADQVAEWAAETEREYQDKWRAASDYRETQARIREIRYRHSYLIRALPHAGDDASGARMRAELRSSVAVLRTELRDLLDTHGADILSGEYE